MSHLRFGIRPKLLGSAALLVALIVAVGLVGLHGLRAVDHIAHEISEQDVAAAETVAELESAVGAVERLHVAALDGDAEAGRGLADADREVGERLAAFRQAAHTRETDVAADAFAAAYAPLAELRPRRAAGAQDGATARADVAERAEGALTAATAMGRAVQRDADHRAELADAQYARSRNLLVALIVLAAVLGFTVAFLIARGIVRSVRDGVDRLNMLRDHCTTDLRTSLEAVAAGDLTHEVVPVTPLITRIPNDELGDLAQAINGVRDNTVASVVAYNDTRGALCAMIGRVGEAANCLSASSEQMASSSEQTGRAVSEIVSAVGDVAVGAQRQVQAVSSAREMGEEVRGATTASAGHVRDAERVAVHARDLAEAGGRAVSEASDAMERVRATSAQASAAISELGAKSERIGGIVDTISTIAEQTNLLALNAAIEAARAGEQGRGFAVVADEVGKLAEESQGAAATIAELIREIQEQTAQAVEVVESGAARTDESARTVRAAREAFGEIDAEVADVARRVAEIAAAVEQIASSSQRLQDDMHDVTAVAEESSASTEQVSASTQQTGAAAQEVAAGAQELAATAKGLRELVEVFRLGDGAAA